MEVKLTGHWETDEQLLDDEAQLEFIRQWVKKKESRRERRRRRRILKRRRK